MTRPYPGRDLTNDKAIYHYRLSQARRMSENAFAILRQKFQIFTRILQRNPENITMIVVAACILYNFIRKNEGYTLSEQMVDQNETARRSVKSSSLQKLPRLRGRSTNAAFTVREQLKDFLNSPQGSVEWQEHAALAI
ncbi:hypothetical protein NQ314_019928 [Rhamnusium bicolor]|uniref:DDE Tnp4 domain-containing protein n=1 Tax=Rhamnusium bicolor TaxID=1586634 RepID=A0AAV8WME0_9CUCU|nr:hypothetical protein NQ314_019928 [Rhamnusium bicolor]